MKKAKNIWGSILVGLGLIFIVVGFLVMTENQNLHDLYAKAGDAYERYVMRNVS
jgi:hypothetical protein